MEDIAPKLYEKIEKAFTGKVNRNMDIRAFKEKLRNSQAKPEDVSLYARALGECASAALIENIRQDELPDGKLYWYGERCCIRDPKADRQYQECTP